MTTNQKITIKDQEGDTTIINNFDELLQRYIECLEVEHCREDSPAMIKFTKIKTKNKTRSINVEIVDDMGRTFEETIKITQH